LFSTWFSKVVFPAPRKPDKTVTGSLRMEIKKPAQLTESQSGTAKHSGDPDVML
jgi:hypothetical protein